MLSCWALESWELMKLPVRYKNEDKDGRQEQE